VTGTNGKTSVSHFVAEALERHHAQPVGVLGTLGQALGGSVREGALTTPDCIAVHRAMAEFVAGGARIAVMEASSHALVQQRLAGLRVHTGVFTNLSRDHLDYHADMQAYAAAKKRLFTDFAPRFAIINHDDPVGRGWCGELAPATQVLSYGLEAGAELTAAIRCQDAEGMSLSLASPWGAGELRTCLMGRFNVSNLLAAAGTLTLLGMPWEDTLHELEMVQPVPGRMMRLGGLPGQPVVVIDYAHTPDALAKSLAAVREHLSGNLVCVFGCGGDRDRGKRAQMGRIAAELADRPILTSDNPRFESPTSIINDVLHGIQDRSGVVVEPDRALAILRAVTESGPGDIVLIAGKGHERYQEISGRRIPFSDEAAVRTALERAA
jgi:UDP-N-acetylmuramoyl-L-alanyl-D-glutamate--2,6-diaminopimelate ligase